MSILLPKTVPWCKRYLREALLINRPETRTRNIAKGRQYYCVWRVPKYRLSQHRSHVYYNYIEIVRASKLVHQEAWGIEDGLQCWNSRLQLVNSWFAYRRNTWKYPTAPPFPKCSSQNCRLSQKTGLRISSDFIASATYIRTLRETFYWPTYIKVYLPTAVDLGTKRSRLPVNIACSKLCNDDINLP
jgi:hypothetical protein